MPNLEIRVVMVQWKGCLLAPHQIVMCQVQFPETRSLCGLLVLILAQVFFFSLFFSFSLNIRRTLTRSVRDKSIKGSTIYAHYNQINSSVYF